MSNPLQPSFSGGLPRPPPAGVMPVFGALPPPPGTLKPGFPRPMPGPPVRPLPASSAPVIMHPLGGGPRPIPAILPPKQTTLYVGKIAASISDQLIRQLLEACGPVKSWKRMEDPDTKQLKPFGFCEYEDAEGVLRALNLLQNLSVGGQELLLKCNTGTQKYIAEYEARRAQNGPQAMEVDDEDTADKDSTADADNRALEVIMGLVSAHAQTLPPEPAAAADSFLSSLRVEADQQGPRQEHKSGRDRSRSAARRESRGEHDEERVLEASFQRERERERKEAEARLQEQDNAYKTALRKWEAQESDRRKYAEREKEHEKDLAKERARQVRAELDSFSDDEDQLWRRKLYAGSRRAVERKRRRMKENDEDELDRTREAEELAKRARHEAEREKTVPVENGTATSPSNQLPAVPSNPRLEDPNDSITQAMMNAAKAPRKSPAAAASATSPGMSPQSQPTAAPPRRDSGGSLQPRVSAGKPKAVLAAFGGDEDEDQPKRQLKIISYTEEEQKAAQRKAAGSSGSKTAIKELIAQVPTDSKSVFAYPVDWKAYHEGGAALREKIAAWVSKKTTELLGEEEVSMVEFIMSQLDEHAAPSKLLEELSAVLDEEANPFVFKLFRMVIFETLKHAADLQD